MNKQYLLGGFVVAAALAGYVILHKQSVPSAETNVPAAQTQATVANTGAQHKTLKELMSMNGTQKCSFTSDDANTQMEVTTYIAHGKVRTDATTLIKATNKKTEMSVIVDTDYMYSWDGILKQGMKLQISVMDAMHAKASSTAPFDTKNTPVDYDQQHNYTCASWTADASIFVPPNDVAFTDQSKMMESILNKPTVTGSDAGMIDGEMILPGAAGSNKNMCASCNAISNTTQKAQCRLALKCQ